MKITIKIFNYISGVVYEQVPVRGYDNVPMKMDIMVPKTKEELPAIVYITGGYLAAMGEPLMEKNSLM